MKAGNYLSLYIAMQYNAGIPALIGSLQEYLQPGSGTFPVNPVQYSLYRMGTRSLEGIALLVTNRPLCLIQPIAKSTSANPLCYIIATFDPMMQF